MKILLLLINFLIYLKFINCGFYEVMAITNNISTREKNEIIKFLNFSNLQNINHVINLIDFNKTLHFLSEVNNHDILNEMISITLNNKYSIIILNLILLINVISLIVIFTKFVMFLKFVKKAKKNYFIKTTLL